MNGRPLVVGISLIALLGCGQKSEYEKIAEKQQKEAELRETAARNKYWADRNVGFLPRNYEGGGGVAAGDLNSDGFPDIAAVAVNNYCACAQTFFNDGHGNFQQHQKIEVGASYQGSASVSLADIDGDGDMDLILTAGNAYRMDIYKFLNDGKGNFE